MDQQAKDLLDRKQALSIIEGGLGMIQSGNPWMAIASGAGKGIKSYSDAIDQNQATQMKLAESRISLDNAKNAMNMGLFNKALDNQENAQKRNLEFLIAQNHDAATMTDAQTQNMFGLAGHIVAGQYGLAGQQAIAGAMGERANAMMYGADVRGSAANAALVQKQAQKLMATINPATNMPYTAAQAMQMASMQFGGGPQIVQNVPANSVANP
jgi:hypothetical protein